MKRYMIVGLLTTALYGCSDNVASINGNDVSKEAFQSYLKLKNIPESNSAQVQRVLEEYAKREALAAAITDTDLLDMNAVEMEVNEFRKQVLISRYFDQYLNDKVDDTAVANYYAAHAESYQAKKAHLAHILFRVRPDMDEAERTAKLTAASEALSRINRGEDFAEVARSSSEDTMSAGKGGDLGWMKEGAVSNEFSHAAFSLAPGAVSEIVSTTFGYHIIKLIDGPQVVSQSLETVAGDIRYLLRQQAKDAEAKTLMESVDLEVSQWAE
tara:strand:+ start:110465 stop:111274 length:810 start_codon:yes stop_codon:yes gene_type:complete